MLRSPAPWIAALFAFALAGKSEGGVIWQEGFTGEPLGVWPASWTAESNAAADPTNHCVAADPENNANAVLKMYGLTTHCGVASGYRACDFPSSFALEFRVRNGGETTASCQPWRGRVFMQKQATMTSPFRELISFAADGSVLLGGATNAAGSYATGAWHRVKIRYDRQGNRAVIMGWLDGVFLGQVTRTNAAGDSALAYLRLMAASGTVWFDDLTLSIPAPAIGLSAGGVEIALEEPTGSLVAVEFSEDLLSPVWQTLTNTAILGVPQVVHDSSHTGAPVRIYRTYLWPAP